MLAELKPYPEYKDIGQPWVGAVPAHWRAERGKRLFIRMQRPACDEDQTVTCFRDGVVTLRKNRRLRGFTEALKEIGYQGIRSGDLVIHAMDAFAGAVGVSDSDGKGSPVYQVCQPREGVNAKYYAFLVREMSRSQWIMALAKGIRERSTDFRFETFGGQFLPVPPPAEQAGIVRFLGAVDRKVNRFIRAKRRLIEVLTEQKQAIITHAVTKGLNPHAPGVRFKPSGIDWLGDVPAHWEVKRLRHIIEGRLTYGANEAAEHDRTDWPRYLRITDFGGDGGLRADTFRSLPPEIAADYTVQPGDILLARSGATVGKAFLVDERAINACHAGYLIRARPKQAQANPRFLFLYTQSTAYASWRVATFNIATIENIGADKYANLPVPLPPRDEQDEILKGLAELLEPIDVAAAVARREIDLIREYRTRLVADVVTGKIDVRGVQIDDLGSSNDQGEAEEVTPTDTDDAEDEQLAEPVET